MLGMFDFRNATDGRSLRGNVDRNTVDQSLAPPIKCRSLRGNVDRNSEKADAVVQWFKVVPYVGTWIEI